MKRIFMSGIAAGIVIAGFALLPVSSQACSRGIYLGPDNTVVVGRSMDWVEDPGTNLYCFPRGMKRDGAAGPNSVVWTSKYGSVVCTMYDVATLDGMNETGLVVNALWLSASNYGKPDGKKPLMSVAVLGQYILDNYSTVAEAVEGFRQGLFDVIAPMLSNGKFIKCHASISDPTGDTAIIEYVGGKLEIYHGREYQVLTNDPIFSQQLTGRTAARFKRVAALIKAIPKNSVGKEAVEAVSNVIREVSVPIGKRKSATYWRIVHDQKNLIFYFDQVTSKNIFWGNMAEFDFSMGVPVKKLTLSGGKTYSGNAVTKFIPAEPFKFLPVNGQ